MSEGGREGGREKYICLQALCTSVKRVINVFGREKLCVWYGASKPMYLPLVVD